MESPDIQGVIISANTNAHKDLLLQASKNKKIICCEKPAGLSLQELLEVKEEFDKNDTQCIVNYNRRFDP